MNPGDLLLRLALSFAAGSVLLYLPALRGRRTPLAGWAFAAHAAALVGAAALLWHYFVAHRFEYEYVAQFSSRALSPQLALAASWAGQQGSILLWATLGAVLGLALARQPGPLTRPGMLFVSLAQCAMLALLLVKSPFVRSASIPLDGQGLNPLLEDPWMVAHPPVLFLGYAALAIPFALAAAALVRADYREWNRAVWPWALFGVVTLGTGIALGGIWAYKVLGWGGYWGWDPVENASLVPWLLAIALLHGLLIQRTTGAVVRTNLVIAMLGWLTVLGGTWLTRSGALQDFSVHSFADTGLTTPLTIFLLATLALGLGLVALRWRAAPKGQANWLSLSRESALWLGLVTVLVLATLVAFGTSAPLITRLAGKPAGVQARFYELISLPLGVAMVVLMGVAPVLRWSRQQGTSWLTTLVPGAVVGLLAVSVAAFLGLRDAGQLALVALAGLALSINALWTVRLFRRGWSYGAGYLAHAGIAVMVLGMVLSTSFGRTERVRLPQGASVPSLGYTLTFQGDELDARGQRMLKVAVRRGGFALDARPRLFPSPQGDGEVRKPAIAKHGELYLSPLEVIRAPQADAQAIWLEKHHEARVGDVTYVFTGFRMESHQELMVIADIVATRDGRATTLSPALRVSPSGRVPVDATLAGVGTLSLERIDADRGRVAVRIPGAAPVQSAAVVDFSTKPLINLVWLGALIAVIGSVLAGFRRAVEAPGLKTRRAPAHLPTESAAVSAAVRS